MGMGALDTSSNFYVVKYGMVDLYLAKVNPAETR